MNDDRPAAGRSELLSDDTTRKGCTIQLLLLVFVALVVLLYIVMVMVTGIDTRFTRG